MKKTLIIILAITVVCMGAVKIGPIILQRTNWQMLGAVRLAAGELAYIVNADGSCTLRLGDSDSPYGLPVVDPSAVRIASQRLLDPISDYYVETVRGATALPDGTYAIGVAAVAATGGLHIVSQDKRTMMSTISYTMVPQDNGFMPSSVTTTWKPRSWGSDPLVQTNEIYLLAQSSLVNGHWATIQDLQVWAWDDTTPRGSSADMREINVTVSDATADQQPTSLRQMQNWLRNNEGQHWSLHQAIADVFINGKKLVLDAARRWSVYVSGDNTCELEYSGTFVARTFLGGGEAGSNWCHIVAATVTTNVMTMHIATALATSIAPTIQTMSDMGGVWQSCSILTSSWPNRVSITTNKGTFDAYKIEVSAAAKSGVFKATVEFSGESLSGVEVRSLKIDGHLIILNPDGSVTWQ